MDFQADRLGIGGQVSLEMPSELRLPGPGALEECGGGVDNEASRVVRPGKHRGLLHELAGRQDGLPLVQKAVPSPKGTAPPRDFRNLRTHGGCVAIGPRPKGDRARSGAAGWTGAGSPVQKDVGEF